MVTEVYIGTNKLDNEQDVSVVFSGGDIRDLKSGRINSSYNITLPLTEKNKRLLHHNHEADSFDEVTETGYVFRGGILILKGKVAVLTSGYERNIEIIIQGTGWIDHFKDKMMSELDLTAHDHEYNAANIEASWTGSGKFYRYPMIFMAKLFSEEDGATANWLPNDFIPMFRIIDILTEIFKPFTLEGDWLTDAAELYLLGKEPQAEAGYLDNKKFDMKVALTSDNYVSTTYAVGETKDIVLSEATVDFNDTVEDDGNRFNSITNRYQVPETGTYYFKYNARAVWTATNKASMTINSQRIYLRMYRLRGSTTTELEEMQVDYTNTDILNAQDYTINTGHKHFEAGDYVWVTIHIYQNLTNGGGLVQTISQYLTTATEFQLIWDKRCLCIGLGKTITAVDFMPVASQIDFVKAVKEVYNLRFTPDLMRQVVHVDSMDRTLTDNVKALEKVDLSTMQLEHVSSNYANTMKLKLKSDASDKAVEEYLRRHDEPYLKTILLTSAYAKKEIEIIENSLFAYTVSGNMWFMSTVIDCIRIFGDVDTEAYPYYPFYRSNKFLPRLLNWSGLTSGTTWFFDSTVKTTYPKAVTVDMANVFSTCWLKTMHLIDKGKIVKFEMSASMLMLQEFITVLNDIDEEGFRAKYELTAGLKKYYCYLNKIEFSGDKALLELIIKH